MQTLLLAILCPAGYLGMWMTVARWHYRWWYEHDHETKDSSRRISSGFVGLVWPLTSIWLVLYGLTTLIGWAETTPSLKERKAKRVKAKHERLRDLQKQIDQAEAELCEATGLARTAREEGTPLIAPIAVSGTAGE